MRYRSRLLPLGPLRSTGSAAVGSAADRSAGGCAALFVGFPAYYAESDFSCPCIIGYWVCLAAHGKPPDLGRPGVSL